MNIRQVLVPLDGSMFAASVLPHVTELARIFQARIHLLRVVEPSISGVPHLAIREAQEYVAGVADRLEADGVRDVVTSVWEGSPARAIVEVAQREPIDLIVMSTHGRSRFSRLLLGSAVEAVSRGTTSPLLLLRPSNASVHAPSGPEPRPVPKRGTREAGTILEPPIQ